MSIVPSATLEHKAYFIDENLLENFSCNS